ncbi:MAG: chromosome segregation SMC family protein, partial [Candidatus Aenigmatarchaeota archaeon]
MNESEEGRLAEMIQKLSTLDRRESPAVKAVLSMPGVEGTFSDLVMVPPHYKVAVEVAAGGHLTDVVVENHHQAAECIKFLKVNRIGRARFLPMDKVAPRVKGGLPKGAIGWLSDIVHNDPRYHSVVGFVLGTTACVKDIEVARDIMAGKERYRMVTMDGDLIEPSGAMTGGFYSKPGVAKVNFGQYAEDRKVLDRENERMRLDVKELEKELKSLDAGGEIVGGMKALEERRAKISRTIDALREKKEKLAERRMELREEAGRISVRQARYEAGLETAQFDWAKYTDMQKEIEEAGLLSRGATELETMKTQIVARMDQMGPVNMKAIAEFDSFRTEFDEFRAKVDKVLSEKGAIDETIKDIEDKKKQVFVGTMGSISGHFRKAYAELTGGEADLRLADGGMDAGLMIYASPPGKRLINIDAMSAGEKTLTAFAFLFAIQNHRPAPFYVFDESDSSLDKSNTKRVADLIKKHSELAQFIIISHNDQLIKEASHVYGVSMEQGESKIIGVHLPTN